MLSKGLLLLFIVTVIHAADEDNLGGDNEFEACWERCFQKTDESTDMRHYRLAYAGLYDMGMEARRLKNLRSVNGTAVLLDSTLSDHHDPALNTDLQADETGDAIFQFERNLAAITVHMMGSDSTRNQISIVQFNEMGAITCSDYGCLDSCGASAVLRGFLATTDFLQPLQMNASSHYEANIEAACRMGYLNLHGATCSGTQSDLEHEMAIAFVNSHFHHHAHESDEWDDYSPCDEHFDTRYAVGTHAASMREMKEWCSYDAHPIYMKDDVYYMEAATMLAQCMDERCCSLPSALVAATICSISTDHFGEDFATFTP